MDANPTSPVPRDSPHNYSVTLLKPFSHALHRFGSDPALPRRGHLVRRSLPQRATDSQGTIFSAARRLPGGPSACPSSPRKPAHSPLWEPRRSPSEATSDCCKWSWGYLLARIVICFILLPQYFRGHLFTAYELMQRRFGASVRRLTALIFLITRSLAEGVRVFAVAIVVSIILGTGEEISIFVIVALTLFLYIRRRHDRRHLDRRGSDGHVRFRGGCQLLLDPRQNPRWLGSRRRRRPGRSQIPGLRFQLLSHQTVYIPRRNHRGAAF